MLWIGIIGLVALIILVVFLVAQSQIKKPVLLITALAVVVSGLLYSQLGAYKKQSLATLIAQYSSETDIALRAPLVEALQEATEHEPDNAEYWYLLADEYSRQQSFEQASLAYEASARLRDNDVPILARAAEASYLASNYSLSDGTRRLIDEVLQQQPNNLTVMGVLGMSAYRLKQYKAAASFWQRGLSELPDSSPLSATLKQNIQQAMTLASLNNGDQEQSGQKNTVLVAPDIDDSSPDAIKIRINLSAAEAIQLPADTPVFVFVRQPNGPPMPVAVQRLQFSQLPIEVALSNANLMMQGQGLADFNELELVARITPSGGPAAKEGDYELVLPQFNPLAQKDTLQAHIVIQL